VTCRACELAIALWLLVVTICQWPIDPITNPNPAYSHSYTWQSQTYFQDSCQLKTPRLSKWKVIPLRAEKTILTLEIASLFKHKYDWKGLQLLEDFSKEGLPVRRGTALIPHTEMRAAGCISDRGGEGWLQSGVGRIWSRAVILTWCLLHENGSFGSPLSNNMTSHSISSWNVTMDYFSRSYATEEIFPSVYQFNRQIFEPLPFGIRS
jgi:hypothetical protein